MFALPIFLNIPTPPAEQTPIKQTINVVTYNIRHGAGIDDKLDLDRTAKTIKSFRADIIALQEVDNTTTRTNKVDQAAYLGKNLALNHAFGAFMDFQGGQYGMAILSRYPIIKTTPYRLPDGNEPRIALIIEVELPNKTRLTIANVHFDWVKDDSFRFAQATKLASHLQTIKTPYILLGDFNDEPGSRTINLFNSTATQAKKDPTNHFTFPADSPSKEIDYIFTSTHFTQGSATVINEPLTSDHRPVSATLSFK